MSQRLINDNFWTDTWIEDRDPSEKLIYLYLLTNPLCNIAGIYEIKLKRIAYETGYDKDTVDKILTRFVDEKKILRCEEWILIVNFAKNQSLNPNVRKGMQRIINELPNKVKALKGFERLVFFTELGFSFNISGKNYEKNEEITENEEMALSREDETIGKPSKEFPIPNSTLLNLTLPSVENIDSKISEENFSPTEIVPIPESLKVPLAVREKSEYEISIDFLRTFCTARDDGTVPIFDPVIETPDFAVGHEKEWRAFLAHFIEKDNRGKMKAEREKTFSLKLRFLKWISNGYGNKQNSSIIY